MPDPEPLSPAKVWVVIVNWNGREDTLTCLASITRSTLKPDHILVVDNGSQDGSIQAISTHYPDVETLETGENLGFGRASNLAAELFLSDLTGTHMFLLNNDATISEDTISQLVAAVEREQRIGAAVPKIYYAGSPRHLWYAGGDIDWKQGSAKHRGIGQEDRGQFDKSEPVSFATGCGLLVKRATLEQVGLFDSRYFFFGEDVDLSLRFSKAGYDILYCPAAIVRHKVGHSARRQAGAFAYYHMTRNRLLTMHKHANVCQWIHFGCYFPFLWGWKAVESVVRSGNWKVWKGIGLGLWDFATNQFDQRDF
jgi:GT2 family glycosyltransferase